MASAKVSRMAEGKKILESLNTIPELEERIKVEKRTFLRHRLQNKLAGVLFEQNSYQSSLDIVSKLLREVRRLDDKSLLVDIHLLESKIFTALKNSSKSKAALVAARMAANAIYCPPLQQASLDLQSGVLGAQEGDFKTAYSYFFEAFEGYHGLAPDSEIARKSLKYMLLCKIMNHSVEEMSQVLSAKNVMKYAGPGVDAMSRIAQAFKARDLHKYQQVLKDHSKEFEDIIIQTHLENLYEQMVEQHLLRIIEPYSNVQINHIAKKIKLDEPQVEQKLSQMILDKKITATIDEGNRCLLVYDDEQSDKAYPAAINSLENMGKVVEVLFDKWAGKFEPKEDPKEKHKNKDAKDGKDGKDGKDSKGDNKAAEKKEKKKQ